MNPSTITDEERQVAVRTVVGRPGARKLWCARCGTPVGKIDRVTANDDGVFVRVACHGDRADTLLGYYSPTIEDGAVRWFFRPELLTQARIDRHGRVRDSNERSRSRRATARIVLGDHDNTAGSKP